MEEEKRLAELFKEINEKPDDLDQKIMDKIYAEAALSKEVRTSESRFRFWIYTTIGLLTFSGLAFVIYTVNFRVNSLWWWSGLAVLIPVIIDKIWLFYLQSKRNWV